MRHLLSALSPLAFVAVLLFASCKSPSVQSVPMPDQEASIEDSTMSRIYLMRTPQTFGRLRMMRGYENTHARGRIEQGRYLCWETNAGRKLISAVYERRPVDGGDIEGVLDLLCEAGQVYYVSVTLDATRMGHPQLSVLDESEGQSMLASQSPASVQESTP